MTKEELLVELKKYNNDGDIEDNHMNADSLLLKFINDEDIRKAYDKIHKWYA